MSNRTISLSKRRTNLNFDLSWENDIVRLKRIDLENATFNFKLKLQDGVAKNFAIYGFRNVKITLPSYIKSSSANFKDGVYTFADRKFSEGQHEIDWDSSQWTVWPLRKR